MSYVQIVCEVVVFERTNKRLCKYMVIAHKTIKYSLTKTFSSFVTVYKDLKKIYGFIKVKHI